MIFQYHERDGTNNGTEQKKKKRTHLSRVRINVTAALEETGLRVGLRDTEATGAACIPVLVWRPPLRSPLSHPVPPDEGHLVLSPRLPWFFFMCTIGSVTLCSTALMKA